MWFTNVVKPTHLCNLDCHYCYNEDTRNPIMTREMLRRTVEETIGYAAGLSAHTKVDFIWHGGEPTVAGIDFYREAVRLQKACAGGIRFANSIQTNGTLINAEWIEFFRENGFDVSLSLDGPEDIHDTTRRSRSGKQGSFSRVMRGIRMLRDAGLPHGVCVVISRANRDRVDEIYDFFVQERLPFNVIPLTRSGSGLARFDDLGLDPDEYAEPWIRMFDRWFDSPDSDYAQCTDFVRKSRAILGGRPSDCIGQEQCSSHHVSTDPDGNVYPCATLSADPEWCYGNLSTSTLGELLDTPLAQRAAHRQMDPHCAECKWLHVCHGGCMSRSIKFYGTHDTRDFYCPSLYRIYDHVERRLREVRTLDLSRLPAPAVADTRPAPPERLLTTRRFQHVGLPLVQIGTTRAGA